LELIENDFDGFLEKDNLTFQPSTPRLLFNEEGVELEMKNDIITPAYCSRYKILFPHDYPKGYVEAIKSVEEKYQRRIVKFRELLNYKQHLIFLHSDGELNDWQTEQYNAVGVKFKNDTDTWQERLNTILSKKYPDLTFSCLAFPDFINDMNVAWKSVQSQQRA